MDFDSFQPIYKQIINYYQKQLVRGELHIGDKIPSQREYAEQVRVNPNTVQRAYREMEMMQMVETIRGQGTYITATEEMRQELKREIADRVMANFLNEMRSLGYQNHDLVELVESQLVQGKGDAQA